MPDDFFERTDLLAEMVGEGDLEGHFSVNRVYAAVQHEKGWENYLGRFGPKSIERYHGGGGEKYVTRPLMSNYPVYYQQMADEVLTGGVRDAMEEAMEDMDGVQLQRHAPERSGALKLSGAYEVLDDGKRHASKGPSVPHEDPDPGNPPGFVLGFLQRGYA